MNKDIVVNHSVSDLERMAEAIVQSQLFGIKTKPQAIALMVVAQAEGKHPGSVASEYHIIQNRASLKSESMLARFQEAGGKIEWHDYTDSKVSATFSHPSGSSLRIDWDMDRAAAAGLGGKDNWKKYPRQMLRARVISEGVRAVYPAVLYIHFRAVISFLLRDESKRFERTDAFIEKTVAFAFDVIRTQAIDSAFDLARFLAPSTWGKMS
jgi:hypothetical protein